MFKKAKKGSGNTAGIVVGGGAAKEPPKPATQMIQGTELANRNPKPLKNNKTRRIVVAAVLVVGGIIALIAANHHQKPPVTDQPLPQVYVKRQAADLVVVQGTITKLDAKTVVIQKIDGSQQASITADTTYKKGKSYLDGEGGEVKAGMPIKLTYDKNTNEAFIIWYGY